MCQKPVIKPLETFDSSFLLGITLVCYDNRISIVCKLLDLGVQGHRKTGEKS